MLIAIIEILGGMALLYVGAEWLVRASASLALKMGVTSFLVGLTIIGYGTSTPEMIVCIDAIWTDHVDLAVGNIVGSNLFNTALILGVGLLIQPATYNNYLRRFDAPLMAIICGVMWWVGYVGHIGRIGGAIFLIVLILYTMIALKFSKDDHKKNGNGEITFPIWNLKWSLPMLPVSFALLVIGSNLFLKGSISVAKAFHVSDAVIGLTIVAAGTSLPELATTIMASCRKQEQLVVGNIVGSNIFNILGIVGVLALIRPLKLQDITTIDYVFMVGINVFFAILLLFRASIGRITGAGFIAVYGGYLWYVLSRLP